MSSTELIFMLNAVTSTAAIDGGSAHQFVTIGALLVNLRTTGAFIPYVTLGAGVVSTTGTMPSAALRGNYQFLLGNLRAPVNETDSVTVQEQDDATWAGILGGGVKHHVSPRWGIRFNVRVALSKNAANTLLEASPEVVLGQRPAGRGNLAAEPSSQFSNSADSLRFFV